MVYLINIALILFFNLAIPETVKGKRKALCTLYAVQWILISGLRDYSVGADTYDYKIYGFDVIYRTSFSQIFQNIGEYLRGAEGIKDPGYPLFEKICQIFIGNNYTLFLIIIACIFTIPMAVWIYRHSENVCFSFMIYSTLFYSFFAITGHRQTIATGLVIFLGYECMKKNKLLPLLLLHTVAFFIHKSSICFLVLYFAKYVKVNKIFWTVSSACILLSFAFRNQLMKLLGSMMNYDQYTEQYENAGAYTFTAIILVLFLGCMLLYSRIPQDEDLHYSTVALALALIFVPLTFVNPSAMRVVQYFSVFIMLLVPKLIKAFNAQSQPIINLICYIVLCIPLVSNLPQYKFIF